LRETLPKTRCFESGYMRGGSRFEEIVNKFLSGKDVEMVHLCSYTRAAQGMNLLDYKVFVHYWERPPRETAVVIGIVEEGYFVGDVCEEIDRRVEELLSEQEGAQLVEIQSAFYEVEAPGRGMYGKDIAQLPVHMLVFRWPVG